MSKSILEERFIIMMREEGIPPPLAQYKFFPPRMWRFDFYWPDDKIALEVEGFGRHHTYRGYMKDCEKYNQATKMGIAVYRVVGQHLKNGYAINLLKETLNSTNEKEVPHQ